MSNIKKESGDRRSSENHRLVIRLCITLFIITAVTAVLLAGVNALTKEPIANLAVRARNRAMQTVMPDSTILENETFTSDTITIYTLKRPDGSYSYCVEVTPYGFGGPINMIVGIEVVSNGDQYEKRVVGVAITSMSETAGLGTRAKDKSFLSRFSGLIYPVQNEDGTLNVSPSSITTGRGDVDVDAITGATVTSIAVTNGVNNALDAITVNTDGHVTFDGSVDGSSGATTSNSESDSENINLSFINIYDIGEVAIG